MQKRQKSVHFSQLQMDFLDFISEKNQMRIAEYIRLLIEKEMEKTDWRKEKKINEAQLELKLLQE